MKLVEPGIGLIFWATITFSLLLFLLGKFAWKPILKALRDREETIEQSLRSAQQARQEMDGLKAENEKLLQEARMEREKILRDANEMRESIIATAKKTADEEGRKLVASAKDAIEKEKNAAMAQLKNQAAEISVEIAGKLLRKELEKTPEQERLIQETLAQFKLN